MKIYLIALLSLFSIIEDARAQIKHYNYFDVSNGLSSNHLTDLAEAGDGYIWITTNGAGLTRYDGISFENFLDEKETGGLFYYSIFASANDVWFGTENRLLKYSSGNFTSYRIPAVGLIKKIVPFTPEILFCIGNLGSAFFSTTQGTIKHQSISGLKFNDAIYQDHILYAGTTQGLWSFKNDTWEKVALVTDFQLGNCSLVTPDMQGNILMVDTENGLVKYSRDGMADILADPADFPVDKISFLKEGALGDIFLGTTDQGILIFQPYDSLWQNLDNRQLNYDDISNMIFDRWENAWIATRGGGLIRFSSQNFTLRKWPELSGKYIDRLNMWNDTLHIAYRDAQSEILVHDKIRPFLRSGDEGEALLAATRMSPVRKWYSTETALYYVSDSLHYKVPVGGSAAYGTVSQILGLDSQEVLILSGDQLYRMKVIDTGAISGPVFLDTLLINGGVDALLRDQAERIWYYGPRKAGILGATSLDVGSSRVTALLPIDQKRILIGTQNNGPRLFRDFNQANTGAEILVDGNSFPEIRALALDESGKIWISLRNEVWETEISGTDAMVIRRYNEKVGWPRLETRQNALEVDRNGHVFIGTSAGLLEILPQANNQAAHGPILSLVSIESQGQKFDQLDPRTLADLNKLGPGHRDMVVSLKAIDQKLPLGISYFYQIDQQYNEWTPAKTGGEFHFLSLAPGSHLFRAKALSQLGLESEVIEIPFRILQPFYFRWWFILATLVLVSSLIWLFYHWRLNRQLLQSRKIAETLQMQNKVLRLEQDARRLQMNPHFIFNALQSIQQKIASGQKEAARIDLQSFAKMMRGFLDHSRKEHITLEEEVELLSLYLRVEQELKNHAFTFDIIVPDFIDPSFIEIPGMLIQPFVENAVKHGLPGNGTTGYICIKFEARGKYLACIVEDNGKGFDPNPNREYDSAGIAITRSRLENFFKSAQLNPLVIENRQKNGEGQNGTKVTIVLPVQI